ncbi:MAG TPA: PH domain-containing protein [Pyrinomonadaceae bacterium]|jgi:membrane protein YdbS with pleckstrin-like domain|nr:PH domain-containing protein [Pyrinomonadaceae bacterium]
MHCTNCGTYIPAGTRFCAGCGAAAVDPEMTRMAAGQQATASRALARDDQSSDIERQIFTARPTLLFIKAGYALAALCAILLTILLAYFGVSALIAIPVALPLLLIPAFYHIKRNTIRYTLTDAKIEIDQGLIARTTRNIPLKTIQDVTVSATIPQRMLGYGNLIIDNASEQGGNVVLRNISNPRHHADLLLRELRRSR